VQKKDRKHVWATNHSHNQSQKCSIGSAKTTFAFLLFSILHFPVLS
jgi:hypothetical protein